MNNSVAKTAGAIVLTVLGFVMVITEFVDPTNGVSTDVSLVIMAIVMTVVGVSLLLKFRKRNMQFKLTMSYVLPMVREENSINCGIIAEKTGISEIEIRDHINYGVRRGYISIEMPIR